MKWVLQYFACEVFIIISAFPRRVCVAFTCGSTRVSQCSLSASQAHAHLRLLFHPLSQVWNADAWPQASQGPPPSLSLPLHYFQLMCSFSLMLKQDQISSNINNIPQVLSPLLATNVSCLLSFILNFLEDLSMITVFVPIYSPIYCLWLFVHSTAHVGIYVNEHVCAYTHIHTHTHKFL